MLAPSTFDDVVQLRKAWFPPNSGSIWRTAFRRSSSSCSGERQDPPLRASVAFGLGGWCCLRRRQVSNAFQSGKHLGYGAARAVIARVRNTANIAISSFNYLLVKHVMCHVHILDFLKERRNCVEDAGVADRSVYIWVWGATEQKTGLTAYRFARDSLSENMLRDVT